MDEISNWVKNIILVILFATFIDLLLPSEKFSRVVKMTTGLVIILAMLSPAISILNGKISMDSWLFASTNTPSNLSLQNIQNQGQKMADQISKQTETEWETELQTYVANEVESWYPLTVSKIDISVDTTRSQKLTNGNVIPVIQWIRLYVAKRDPTQTTDRANPSHINITQVPSIPKVKIGVNQAEEEHQVLNRSGATSSQSENQIVREVSSQLSTQFDLPSSAIDVQFR